MIARLLLATAALFLALPRTLADPAQSFSTSAQFNETLLIRPLTDGKVLMHWEFEVRREYQQEWTGLQECALLTLPGAFAWFLQTRETGTGGRHFTLFPKSLGEVLHALNVHSFSLALTSGRWVTEEFGYESWTPSSVGAVRKSNVSAMGNMTRIPVPLQAPHGAELWAIMQPQDALPAEGEEELLGMNRNYVVEQDVGAVSSVDRRWRELQAALSGLFCASLGQMKSTQATAPIELYSDQNLLLDRSTFRYATLPREAVCTENLAPFIKMLPCRTRRGLAAVLDPKKLYGQHYHSIQIKVSPMFGADGAIDGWTLKQSVSVLFDTMQRQEQAWSISSILGEKTVLCSCPLSQHAAVHLLLTGQLASTAAVVPAAHQMTSFSKSNGDAILSWDLKHLTRQSDVQPTSFCPRENLELEFGNKQQLSRRVGQDTIQVTRYLSAPTLKSGVLHLHLYNPTSVVKELQLFDSLPWFCLIKWTSLKVSMDENGLEEKDLLSQRYTPALIRQSPSQWFFHFLLPPNSTFSLELQFEKSLLTANDYPPDVSRGFDIGSAIIRVREWTGESSSSLDVMNWTRFYTDGMVVLMPFPDFSMPFNVIAFISTVLAFFYGSLFNMTYSSSEEILKRRAKWEEKPSIGQRIKQLFNKIKSSSATQAPQPRAPTRAAACHS